MASPTLVVFAVASPYAWDVVESILRTGSEPICVDNHGDADPTLPGVTTEVPVGAPFMIGLSSSGARLAAARSAIAAGLGAPATLLDPTSVIASTSTLSHGVYVNAGVVIGSQATIGCHSNVNRSASVGHDNRIGVAVSIGPGAVLAGNVEVVAGAFIGAGAVILPNRTIGRWAIVGAGSVVTRDVGPGEVVAGNPARVLRVLELPDGDDECPHCSTR